MTRRRSIALRAAALLGAGLALVACGEERVAVETTAPLVVVVPVDVRDLEERIQATGELKAVERAEIAAEVDGRVTAILVEEGRAADAGDALLRIDPERRELEVADARARRAEARTAVREAERDAERLRQLHARGAASDARLDQAETALAAARSRLRAAEARVGVAERALADATVRAPFAGLVARRHVSRGEYVRPGEPLFELVSLDPIEVEFHLPEADSGRVRMGLPVEVRVAPYPGDVFDARVSMISPTIAERTRTLRVKAELENPVAQLRPGLFAEVDLGVDRREDVPMVPEQAVLQRADGPVVYRLRGEDRVERRVIETGIHRVGEVEVVAGLQPDDWVAVSGHTSLVDGAVVRVRRREGGGPGPPLARAASGAGETR